MPELSIVIPSYKSQGTIQEVLDSISKQKGVSYEVLLFDDCPSQPLNFSKLKHYSFVKYFKNEINIGLSKSINKGLKLSRGKYFMILHDDCVLVGTDWLKRILSRLNESDVGAVIGEHLIKYNSLSPTNKIFSYIYGLGLDVSDANKNGFEEVKHLGDKCDVFRKDYLLNLGAFDESFKTAGEDTELSNRIIKSGKKILLNHDAKVIHLFSQTERQSNVFTHLKKAIQLNRNGVIAYMKTGSNYKLDMFFVWILLVAGFFGFIPYLAVSLIVVPFALPLGIFSILFAILLNSYFGIGFIVIPFIYLFGKSLLKAKKALINKKEFNFIPILVMFYAMVWDLLAGLAWIYSFWNYFKGE